jgi:2-phosphosulfolactate phosphatase
VANAASRIGRTVNVYPAGERWADGTLRPALEDLLGAGAILRSLPGTKSPEANLAIAAFERMSESLAQAIRRSASGRELVERGFGTDVDWAVGLDVSDSVPFLKHGAFQQRS